MTSGEMREAGKRGPSVESREVTVADIVLGSVFVLVVD